MIFSPTCDLCSSYQRLVAPLQGSCSGSTSGIVLMCCGQLAGKRSDKAYLRFTIKAVVCLGVALLGAWVGLVVREK